MLLFVMKIRFEFYKIIAIVGKEHEYFYEIMRLVLITIKMYISKWFFHNLIFKKNWNFRGF